MTKTLSFSLALSLFALTTGCGGDDVVEQDPSCSLTAQQIGDDTIEVVGSYLIDDNGALTCDPDEETLETYARYTELIPAEYRDIVAMVSIDMEASGGTDGALQDLYDENDEPTGDRFIALDVTGVSTELERTIVHETGHLIFIIPASDELTQYQLDFNEAFPPGDAYTEDAFVTEYAASVENGQEDIAESWAMYVFEGTAFAGDADDDGELDTVCDDCVARDKVEFFDSYPELVTLRSDILDNAGF